MFRRLREHAVERAMEWVVHLRRRQGALAASASVLWGMVVTTLIRSWPGTAVSVGLVEDRLRTWSQAGFLVSRTELLRRVQERAAGQPNAAHLSSMAAVATRCGRSTGRWMTSYASHQAALGRAARLLHITDDKRTACVGGYWEAAAVSRRYGIQVVSVTREEREALASRLARHAGVESETVLYAVLGEERGEALGAQRNVAILMTSGMALVTADDRTVCSPRAAVDASLRPGCAVDSRRDPRRHLRFADLPTALARMRPAETAIDSLHGALLGQTLDQSLRAFGGGEAADLEHADDNAVEDLWRGRGRVLLTATGVLDWSQDELSAQGPVRRRPGGQGPAGGVVTASFVGRPTLGRGGVVESACFALDNRALLPPFVPQLGDLELYWVVLRRCYEDAYCGHVPWTLRRVPDGSAPQDYIRPRRARADLASVCLAGLLEREDLALAGRDPARRMQALGQSLVELGQLPAGEFSQEAHTMLLSHAAACHSLRGAGSGRTTPTAPGAPAARPADELREALLRCGPVDLFGSTHRHWAHSCAATQRLVCRYGRLLRAWPGIVASARGLGECERAGFPFPEVRA